MTSNKQNDLRKIENFVRSKGKTANFRKPCKNFKIVDEHLTYNGEIKVLFGNIEKFKATIALYFTINLMLNYKT